VPPPGAAPPVDADIAEPLSGFENLKPDGVWIQTGRGNVAVYPDPEDLFR
jgi:hypothetical protein